MVRTIRLGLSQVLLAALVGLSLVPAGAADAQETSDELAANGFVVVLERGADVVKDAPGLANRPGSALTHVFDQLGAFAIDASPAAVEELARNPRVAAVVPNQIFSLFDVAGFGVLRIDANDAHQQANGNHRGAGTRIIVIDSGADLDHPDLAENLDGAAGANCVNQGASPDDDHGHGTHVAGIAAAAYGPNGFGVAGVAPEATIVPIKSFDSTGNATTAQVLCGINHAITVASDGMPTVVNMSFGEAGTDSVCDGTGTDVIHEAVCTLADSGAIIVAAAGNSAVNTSTFVPAVFDEVIAVSAYADLDGAPGALAGCGFSSEFLYDCDDTFADFSNYGADVDVMAPGFNIYSTLHGGGHGTKSGTSMAAPHVAGVVSLLLEADDTITAAEAQALLQDTGECPLPAGGTAAGGPTCENQGTWAGDPDSFTEPLVNALRAAQRATDPVRWISPRAGRNDPGIINIALKVAEPAPGASAVQWKVDNGAWQAANFDSASGYYVSSWDASGLIPGDYMLTAEADDGSSVTNDVITVTVPVGQFAHWALDDGTGQVAADSTGNGWDANLSGPTWGTGRIGGGLSFDGVDDYVEVPAGVADGVDDMTMTLWVKLNTPGSHALISGANSGNSNELLMFLKSDTEMRFFTGASSGSYASWFVPTLADGSWHHLAVVRDAAGDSVEFFLDGTSQGTRSTAVGPLSIASGGLMFGQEQDSVGGGFDPTQALDGTLDEVYFFNHLLTAQEIADLATVPDATPPSAPGPLTAAVSGLDVSLSWSAAVDEQSGISAYRIYRGTIEAGPKSLLAEVAGTAASHVDSTSLVGATYYYEVTAVNGADLEGDPSNEASATTEEPPDTSLIGYWALDEAAGSIAADSSSFQRNGTVVGSEGWGPGLIGGALGFAPASDRVDLPSDILNGVGDLSVALWTKLESGGSHALVSGANSSNSNELLIFLKSPTELRVFTGQSSGSFVKWTVPSLADGSWHHIAVVRDAGNNQVEFFLDGASQGLKSSTINPLTISAGGLMLGQEQDSLGGGFSTAQALDGSLDEVRFYDRLLDAAEIAVLATPPADTTPPSQVTGFTASANGLAVNLSWTAAVDAESGISTYRIYRDTVSGGPKSLLTEIPGTELAYTDATTEADVTYFYEVAAVNGANLEGPLSEEREATPSGQVAGGLIGHWTFDEGSGDVAADSSPSGNDGALVGTPTWGLGRLGNGIVIDGVDDYIDVPSAAANGLGDMTVAVWVQLNAPGSHALVSGANSRNSNELLLFIKSETEVRFFTGHKSNTYAKWTVPALDDGAWHHLAVVRDASGDTVELFLDGASLGTISKNVPLLSIASGGLVFGQEQDSVGGGFSASQALDGTLDEVRFYDRLLTPQEIAALASP